MDEERLDGASEAAAAPADGEETAADQVEEAPDEGWPAPSDGTAGAWQLHLPYGRRAGQPAASGPAPGVGYAEFGLRLVALAIDLILIWAGTYFLFNYVLAIVRTVAGPTAGGSSDPGPDALGVLIVGLLLLAAAAYSVSVLRGSPGQLVLGLATVGRRRGAELPFLVAAVRQLLLYGPAFVVPVLSLLVPLVTSDQDLYSTIVQWLPMVVLVWYALLGITALASPRGQGLHDLVVGSVVVREVGEDAEGREATADGQEATADGQEADVEGQEAEASA